MKFMNILKPSRSPLITWQREAAVKGEAALCDKSGHVILSHNSGDFAIKFLWFILVGYAFMGKSFAYIGLYPLYVSEMSIMLGVGAMFYTRRIGVSLRSPVMVLFFMWMIWGAFRTVPYMDRYGMMTLRDGVIWGYILFTMYVYELMMAKPLRFVYFMQRYSWFALVCPFVLLVAWTILLFFRDKIPFMPLLGGSEYKIIAIKQGDIFVHLTGAITFSALFSKTIQNRGAATFRIVKRYMTLPVLRVLASLLIVVLASSGRGGLLAFTLSLIIYCVFIRKTLRIAIIGFVLVVLVGFSAFSGISVSSDDGERIISFDSVVSRMTSMFGSDDFQLESTRKWRLDWWGKIYHYTFEGNYFLGKGFGINIADSDGFQTMLSMEDAHIKLRSPHNVHMNVMARAGVPGFSLWVVMHLMWFLTMMLSYVYAKKT